MSQDDINTLLRIGVALFGLIMVYVYFVVGLVLWHLGEKMWENVKKWRAPVFRGDDQS